MKAFEGGAQPVESIAQRNGELGTGLCQKKASWFANEERRAQALLEQADLVAHGGLRDRQFLGRTGEIHVPRRGLEGAQTRDGWQWLRHKLDLSLDVESKLVSRPGAVKTVGGCAP